ncbi:ribonuclease E/G [Halobacillus sp. B23F22_1]|uniref:ribonuclease E/G n=1 Tax=Halobacillus sp. B23F22_1 TaxID=3459514 RepID=UPI00373EBA6B
MRTIAIHTKTSEKVGLVIDNGQLIEYMATRPEASQLSGSIFKGTVKTIHKSMQAAFVDIGESRQAFLKKELIPWGRKTIENSITEGQSLYVQVTKEPIDSKGAQVTADLTLPGLFTIYQPYGKKVSVSRKIEKHQAAHLKEQVSNFLEEGEGAILRTNAADTDLSLIKGELKRLKSEWNSLNDRKKPGVMWRDDVLLNQLIRKYANGSDEVVVDDSEISQFLKKRFPYMENKIKWRKNMAQYTNHSINELQDLLTKRTITTDEGVQLVFDKTEAMTVVDVNSHRYMDRSLSSDDPLKVNKRAASEIAKQVRLRNESGMILIDFISMKSSAHNQELLQWLRQEIKKDPITCKVHGMTKLGLVEMTRTRQLPSVHAQLLQLPETKYNLPTLWYRLERYLMSQEHQEAVLVSVSPDLYNLKKQLLLEPISSKIPQELFVRQNDHLTGWQIELEGSLDIIREAAHRRGYNVDKLF